MLSHRLRKNALREREIDNARRRVRNAAEKAEQTLRHIVNHDALWDWTDPDRAIREMRARHFGDEFAKLPMTDIEEALKQKGNVLFIIAVYPASRGNVLRYIGKDVQGAAELLYEKAKSVLTTTVTNAKAATRPAPRKLHVRRRSSRARPVTSPARSWLVGAGSSSGRWNFVVVLSRPMAPTCSTMRTSTS